MINKLLQKIGALTCNISLLLNSFLPYVAAIPAYAVDSAPIAYNNSSHQLYFSFDTANYTAYQLFYKTDTKIDSVSGSKLPEYLYLGTCSDGTCLPQSFQSAILKIKTNSGFYFYYFTLKNGQLQIVSDGNSAQLDLSDDELNLLEGITRAPTSAPTPEIILTPTFTSRIAAPSTVGTYDVSFRAHRDDSCGNTGVSNTFTLTDGIIVSNSSALTPPTFTVNPSDDYALTSVTGVWTQTSGGSNITGLNTNEVRWGGSTGYGQSGLRFDGSGVQSFNQGNSFYLGMLTHLNWPITNAASGAKLKITLAFSKPGVSSNPEFTYDFNINETSNSSGSCPSWQQSTTPCDDKITFPNSYGSQVFTIGDIQYTLVIDGFVNAFPGGSPISEFITEEQKNNSAFLVGHLSSVLVENPAISITKKTNNQDITSAPGENLNVGDAVNWSYIIQNTGNVDLSGVSVVDNPTTPISCPKNSLLSGESMTCTASGTVQSGQFTNTATVTANHSTGTVSKSDSSWYFGIPRNICGDGIVNQNTEECDNGSSNGSVCTPTYGNSCNYCSVSCQNISVTGPYCGDGIMNGDEQCDGNDIGNLSTNDFKCNKSCELELVQAKIDICHASDSHNNPYIFSQPNKSGDVSGHAGHTGPIWYPGITIKWGDIIPPFVYIGGTFPGLNWTTEGQAIYNNGCNFAKGHLIVQKTTIPSGDNTSFSISASGTGDITGSSSGTIKDNQDKDYEVTPGVYSVTETVPSGWVKTGDTCQNVVVNAGETKYCQITNTKKGSLKIIKESRPEDTQNFTFTLKDSNDNTKGSAVLDDDGESFYRPNNYTFTNLVAGTYKVTEDSVSGWTLDNINCTNTTGQWGFSSGYLVVDILPGEQPVCTFTNGLDTGTLTAHKFEDNNNNQVQNPGENNLKDWDMNLYSGSNCHSGNYIRNLDTNSSGDANFGNLVPGNYSVRESLKTGWQNSTPLCQNVTVNHNDKKVLNFGNYKLGKIEGRKFYDKDSDRTRDGGEDYLSGWRIFIDENGNGEYNSGEDYDYTDSNGYYKFDGLAIGSYTVCEQMKSGWYNSTPICQTTNISSNDTDTINFGNLKYGSIKVCKIIIDGSGKVVNGSETPNTSFTINWNNGLNPTVFNSGYTPNTKLLRSTPRGQKDAYCTTIDNLRITNYRYSQEIINDSSIWQTPKYNDQYDETINDIGDFYTYNQNTNSNGDINLALDPPGINRTLVILNQYKFGEVEVFKFNDLNGNGKRDCVDFDSSDDTKRVVECQMEPLLPEWTINLSGTSKVTDTNGSVSFGNLSPKTYTLSEDIKGGWTQTNIYCSNDSAPTPTVTITPTSGECSDMDGDRICDSSDNCPTVSNADQADRDANGVGDACDAPITPTMGQHETSCRDGLDNDGDGYVDYDDSDCEPAFNLVKSVNARTDTYSYNHKLVPVTAGENVKCYIGNRLITPTATIQKTNDASGDLAPGSSVGYKIKVVISGNDVTNFKVTDLLSNGFVYRPGSYNVTKNGAPFSITEPVYHSPGVWDLGDLSIGDTIEMNYIADISLNQQPGSYTDLALARGEAKYESLTVYAQGENSQYTEGAFVGTLVPVVKSTQNSVSAGVEKHETSTGEVLGASTELPSTGSSTSWLIISTLMSLLGFLFIKKSNKKMLSIIFILSFFLFPVSTNAVSNLSLRVEEPKTPTNINNVELNFVALDITGAPITVKCLKKSPSDASLTQFGADIALSAGGNASHCSLSSILSSEGNYQFQVLASNGSDNVSSQIVNLDYKTSGPGTPNDYRKDRLNNCDYKIHFKSADDGGKTVKVEIYRADVTSFILDPGSVVSTVYTGSNTEHDINNSVPDCSKTYYYVLRAFDSAGNGSGTTGDSVTITTTSTTTLTDGTTTTTGAIPVVNVTLAPGEGESTTDETTGNLGENDGQGSVLGAQEAVKSFFQKYWLYLIIALIITVGIIRYVLSKKKKTRRR